MQRLGIIGGGQLARMMVQAAISIGVNPVVLAQSRGDSAAQAWPYIQIGDPDSQETLTHLCRHCEIVTFDHELVDLDALQAALDSTGAQARPSVGVLAIAQDKALQRMEFASLGLPVPDFALLASPGQAADFGAQHDYPFIIKAGKGGYDGRGVWKVDSPGDAEKVTVALLERSITPVAEPFVRLVAEFSQQIARRPNGEVALYPLVETVQQDGMLVRSIAPTEAPESIQEMAQTIAIRIAEQLNLVGLLAVEFLFDGIQLWINEIAARPHNSGHYSIEGAETSQFEQHLRAVLDLPLGGTALRAESVVTGNIIGSAQELDLETVQTIALADPSIHLHWYGKEWRPGRKLGHVTVLDDDRESALAKVDATLASLEGAAE